MDLVFTRMPGESYHRRLRSLLLYLCYVFRAIINPLCADTALKVLPTSKETTVQLLFSAFPVHSTSFFFSPLPAK